MPFPAGGSCDSTAGLLADKLGPVLKQSVLVDNNGGAGGLRDADVVAKSAAAAYPLVLVDVFHSSTPIEGREMPWGVVKVFTLGSLLCKSPALIDSMSSRVNTMITTMASTGSHVKPSKLRGLAMPGTKRCSDFPNVPTLSEVEINGVADEQGFCIMSPANRPKPTVDKLAAAIA